MQPTKEQADLIRSEADYAIRAMVGRIKAGECGPIPDGMPPQVALAWIAGEAYRLAIVEAEKHVGDGDEFDKLAAIVRTIGQRAERARKGEAS